MQSTTPPVILIKPAPPKVFTNDAKSPLYAVSPSEYVNKLMLMGIRPDVKAKLEWSIHVLKSLFLSRVLGREGEVAQQIAVEGHSLLTISDEIESLENRLKEARERLSALKSTTGPGFVLPCDVPSLSAS